MERKIGEIFPYNGEWHQCVEDTTDDNCNNCCFQKSCNYLTGDCSSTERSDGKSAAFKKLKKVGEPYIAKNSIIGERLFQKYKLYKKDFFINENNLLFTNFENTVGIEIKQNNEDMEEKYKAEDTPLTRLVGRYVNNLIDYETFEKAVKELYSDKEESKLTLKEFDLEAAKAGKPVCTRDGRKARIICFDAKDTQPIIGLYEKDIDGIAREYLCSYHMDGRMYDDQDCGYDLMMLPEKKEGWVNIYRDIDNNTPYTENDNIYSSRDKAKESAKMLNMKTYIDTIKVEWEE